MRRTIRKLEDGDTCSKRCPTEAIILREHISEKHLVDDVCRWLDDCGKGQKGQKQVASHFNNNGMIQFIIRPQLFLNYMSKEARKKIFISGSHIVQRRYEFKVGWGSAPHPDKVWKGGQDALFVSKNIILVADGVGGWSRMGIDSGVYARRLVSAVKQLLQGEKELYFIERPQELAVQAVQRNEEKGSATLSIITLHPHSGILRCYHVGDSVFGIFGSSGKNIIAEQQQRQFNVPFQVFGGQNNIAKNDSDSQEEQPVSDVFNGCYNQFTFAQLSEKAIVLASDGLWDNLHEDEISQLANGGGDLVGRVRSMVRRAKQSASLLDYQSPFYLKAVKKGHSVPKGGKIDDITIIIAEVVLSGG